MSKAEDKYFDSLDENPLVEFATMVLFNAVNSGCVIPCSDEHDILSLAADLFELSDDDFSSIMTVLLNKPHESVKDIVNTIINCMVDTEYFD